MLEVRYESLVGELGDAAAAAIAAHLGVDPGAVVPAASNARTTALSAASGASSRQSSSRTSSARRVTCSRELGYA